MVVATAVMVLDFEPGSGTVLAREAVATETTERLTLRPKVAAATVTQVTIVRLVMAMVRSMAVAVMAVMVEVWLV